MKRILITGLHSYTGQVLTQHLSQFSGKYQASTISLRNASWQNEDWREFDAVFHVAGIAHDSTRNSDKDSYYRFNTQLTYDAALKAKTDGVRQFIFMSSSIVYGQSAPIGQEKFITRETPVNPESYYGDSKVQAEQKLAFLEDEAFKVCILRCPMIYGSGSKGNYPILSRLARRLPAFPLVKNCRSMLYAENLAEFVRLMIEHQERGIFWPQNAEYSNTSELVRMIAEAHGRKIALVPHCGALLRGLSHFTGLVNKAFGSLANDMVLSDYGENYRLFTLRESIIKTES